MFLPSDARVATRLLYNLINGVAHTSMHICNTNNAYTIHMELATCTMTNRHARDIFCCQEETACEWLARTNAPQCTLHRPPTHKPHTAHWCGCFASSLRTAFTVDNRAFAKPRGARLCHRNGSIVSRSLGVFLGFALAFAFASFLAAHALAEVAALVLAKAAAGRFRPAAGGSRCGCPGKNKRFFHFAGNLDLFPALH